VREITESKDKIIYETKKFFVVEKGSPFNNRLYLFGKLRTSSSWKMAEMVEPKRLHTAFKGSYEAWYETVKAKDYVKAARMRRRAEDLFDEADSLEAFYE
jgi:hypothetical protein